MEPFPPACNDPFGHIWVLLSWEKDLGPGEIERRAKDYFAQ
jgi:hypothetical protein